MLNLNSTYARNRNIGVIIGIILVVAVLGKLPESLRNNLFPINLQTYGFTEFLISFSGGFVRRGLLGEILLWVTSVTGIAPQYLILSICFLAYAFVCWFLFKKLKAKGYCWWIALSPLLCGLVFYVIRKDYLLYSVMIGILCLVKNSNPSVMRRFCATLLCVFGIFLHEAFIFWGIPIFALVMLTQKGNLRTNVLMLSLPLAAFVILCIFKGNMEVAQSIITSWNGAMHENVLYYKEMNSIGALTWDTADTVKMHVMYNTGAYDGTYFGIVFWPLCYVVVYYFISFFFVAFQPVKDVFDKSAQTQLSFMFLAVSVCLLPMFAGLSCDYARLFQYSTISAMLAFLILDKSVKEQIIPGWAAGFVSGINTRLSRLYVPSKGLLLTLLLIIGISPWYYNLEAGMLQSPLGATCDLIMKVFEKVVSHL